MKLAVSSFAWPVGTDGTTAERLAFHPIVQGVELVLPMAFADPGSVSEHQAMEHRSLWEDRGLRVISVQSLAFGKPELQLLGSIGVRDRFMAHLVRMAELATWLGAARMVFGSPANRKRGDMPMEVAMDLATNFFRELGARLDATGVVLCIEPNPPIYGGCDMLIRVEEALELVERVGHPNISLQMDTGAIVHQRRQGDHPTMDTLRQALVRSAHMHISVPGLLPVETGDIEQAEIAQQLGAIGLQWLSIEMKHTATDPMVAVEQAVEAACRWYPIERRS